MTAPTYIAIGIVVIAYAVYLIQIFNDIRGNVERIADTLNEIERRKP